MFLVTSNPMVTAGLKCAPDIFPNTYIPIITVRPNAKAIAIHSANPPISPIPTLFGSTV